MMQDEISSQHDSRFEDHKGSGRQRPMKVLALGLGRTGTKCKTL